MSKLKELIDKLCPDGVEYKKLGDLGVFESIGVDKKTIEGQPLVTLLNYVDVYKNTYIDNSIPKMIVSASTKKVNACTCEKGDIFITPTSETKDDIGHASVITETLINTVYSYHIMRFRLIEFNMTTSFFIRYLFESNFIQKQIYRLAKGLTRFGLSKYDFAKIEIPLPPIEVQEEILRILDNFTKCTAELQAELQAREEQYEYYRNKLLSFEGRTDVEYKKLGEVCKLGTGSHNTQDGLTEGQYPFYTRGSEVLYLNDYDYDETAIITAGDGAGVGKVFHFVKGKYALHQRAYRIVPNEKEVLPRFVYYYIGATFYDYIMRNSVSSSVVSIRRPMMVNCPILVPPLAEQQRIVDILDRFYTLTNDITAGLPAEIEARQNQYEFYRNRLLSFKRLTT